jgi:hypothetical protein
MAQRQGDRSIPEGIADDADDADDALERRLRALSFPPPPTGARERTWERIEALLADAGNGCAPDACDSER